VTAQSHERTKVFISYSHQDVAWLRRLRVHLKPLERENRIEIWDDTRIKPGSRWREEIEQALAATKVAVLLVSADFLASDFIARDELPTLLRAAEKEGAIILPLILSPSRFERTPRLAQFQSVNNPSKPLIGLPKAEQEALLVKVSEDIETFLNPPPEIVTPPLDMTHAVPNCGAMLYKLCDRASQENNFIEYFNKCRKELPGRPQVYFIHGEKGECHDSFVERLMYGPIREIAEKEWGEQHGVFIHRQPEWPHEGEPPELEQNLKINLIKEFNIANAGSELSATALSELAAELLCPIVIIQHNIYAQQWSALDRRQIEWYLNYWAELQTRPAGPQFLIFLNVIYPSKGEAKGKTRTWWKPWIVASGFSKSQIQAELAELVAMHPAGCPCFLLKELMPLKQFDVQDWFSRYHIYDEQTQYEKVTELFPKHVEHLSMSRIQKELKKIHEEFVYKRGYF
jgi:hypothetical protein